MSNITSEQYDEVLRDVAARDVEIAAKDALIAKLQAVATGARKLRIIGKMVGAENATIHGRNAAGKAVVFIEDDAAWREFNEALALAAEKGGE